MSQLCRLDSLAKAGSLGFELELDGVVREGFVVFNEGQPRAFVNSCPHTGAPLNWMPDIFLSAEGTHIQCSLHGALFRPEDGVCIFGPCAGESLQPLGVIVHDGSVVLSTGVPLVP